MTKISEIEPEEMSPYRCKLLDKFFQKRFGKTQEQDPSYYATWFHRFREGDEIINMDADSLKAYKKVFKEMNEASRPKNVWCECVPDTLSCSHYVHDAYCVCGEFKHHYHCPICGGITQKG